MAVDPLVYFFLRVARFLFRKRARAGRAVAGSIYALERRVFFQLLSLLRLNEWIPFDRSSYDGRFPRAGGSKI